MRAYRCTLIYIAVVVTIAFILQLLDALGVLG